MAYAATREHARELIDRIALEQVPAVVAMLEKMLDPVERAQATAPFEDEEISEEEERDVALAKAETGPTTSMQDVLAQYGVTIEELRQMDFPAEESRRSAR
jgi:hypothetical protein